MMSHMIHIEFIYEAIHDWCTKYMEHINFLSEISLKMFGWNSSLEGTALSLRERWSNWAAKKTTRIGGRKKRATMPGLISRAYRCVRAGRGWKKKPRAKWGVEKAVTWITWLKSLRIWARRGRGALASIFMCTPASSLAFDRILLPS